MVCSSAAVAALLTVPETRHPSPEHGRRAVASVVIPAHNEQGPIGRTLQALTMDAEQGEFDIVVVCNDCTDVTAEEARRFAGVRVIALEEPSQVAALREGDRQADVFSRIYLDGDVELSTQAARDLTAPLRTGVALAAGVPGRYALDGAPLSVQLFYEFRQRLPVFADGIIGAGVYAMSSEGRERFGEWPDVWGDDQYVYRLFGDEERIAVRSHRTLVEPAPSLSTVVRRGVRVRQGNRQLSEGAADRRSLPSPRAGVGQAVRASLKSPRGWASAAVFVTVTSVIRLRSRVDRGQAWL